MLRLRAPKTTSPHLLALTIGPLILVVVGIVGLAVTGSYWLLVLTVLATIIASAALTLDIEGLVGEPPADDDELEGSRLTPADRPLEAGTGATGAQRDSRVLNRGDAA